MRQARNGLYPLLKMSVPQGKIAIQRKKAAKLPPLRATLIAPDPNDTNATSMELDELCQESK
jgi:hypothetical protein